MKHRMIRRGTLAAVLLVCWMARMASADPLIDLSYGVETTLHESDNNLLDQTVDYKGQTTIQGDLTVASGFGTATGHGAAQFFGNPMMVASTSSSDQGSASALTYLWDTLTFHFSGGGSKVVQAQVSGSWATTTTGGVGWGLSLPSVTYGESAGPVSADPGFVPGSYSFTGPWTVADNVPYRITLQISASGYAGGTAYIDDPLYFGLPAGVTLTTNSGNTYAVPEPASFTLLSLAVGGLLLRRRRQRA